MNKVVLASNNPGKLQELEQILAPLNWQLTPQSELIIPSAEETGVSFIENALIKARHASELAECPALADDSGLVVPALGGEPGIYSSRYAGEKASAKDNNQKLLDAMKDLEGESRKAFFYCVIAFIEHANSPTPLIAQGRLDGYIVQEARGSQGFGYDPLFFIPNFNLTAAELPPAIKNKISHRAKALEQLTHLLDN